MNDTTHQASSDNKRSLTLQEFKHELAHDYQKQVQNYFNGNKEKSLKFMSAVVYSVQKNPALLECSKESLFTAFMTCAEYELFPSNASGEAYVIPYASKAEFQLGYQGIITLLYRAGVDSVTTNIVRSNDYFEYEEGLNPKLIHKPDPFSSDRGEALGVYAIASVNGQKVFKVMSKNNIENIKGLSKAKASKFSPWNSGNDPEMWMWRKTCIKQLSKLLPKNDSLVRAMAKDNEDSIIPTLDLDADGPAVGRALHEPQDNDGE